jgi:hypothetical protein
MIFDDIRCPQFSALTYNPPSVVVGRRPEILIAFSKIPTVLRRSRTVPWTAWIPGGLRRDRREERAEGPGPSGTGQGEGKLGLFTY